MLAGTVLTLRPGASIMQVHAELFQLDFAVFGITVVIMATSIFLLIFCNC
jgi:hypothetical protein